MIDPYMAIEGILCKMPNQTGTVEQIAERLFYSKEEVSEMLEKLCAAGNVIRNDTIPVTYSISENHVPLVPKEELEEFISARKESSK